MLKIKSKIIKMKKITLILVLFTQIVFSQFNELKKDKMISITIDWSKLIENESEFDSGLDILGTFVFDRSAVIQPLLKFEAFPNINFYKYAIGGNYTITIHDRYGYDLFTELSAGFELGQIIRKRPNLDGFGGWWTYGLNTEIRVFKPFKNIPIIASYNYQRRTDFQMYGSESKFVGSLYLGIGINFL